MNILWHISLKHKETSDAKLLYLLIHTHLSYLETYKITSLSTLSLDFWHFLMPSQFSSTCQSIFLGSQSSVPLISEF